MRDCFISHAKLTMRWQSRKVDGKLRRYGPYHYLQRWVNGKNVTTYVPPEKVEFVRALIRDGLKFEQKMTKIRESALRYALKKLRL